MRLLLAFSFALLSWSACAATDNWTGGWDTRWRDGGARLELRQAGDKVEGKYAVYDGTVEGAVDGKAFHGRWHQGARSGGFDFIMAADGKSFVGRYETGEWWTGARVAADANAGEVIDLATPRAAMRTFLRGANSARYDAPDEMIKSVAAVDFGDAKLTPEVKLARTKALFNLVDATTFRLFAIPDTAAGDHLTVTLDQAGTSAELPVRFAKTGERWGLVMPDDDGLASLGKALFARSGGHPPGPDDYKLRRTPSDAYRVFTRAFSEWNQGGRAEALSALDLSGIPEAIRDYRARSTRCTSTAF